MFCVVIIAYEATVFHLSSTQHSLIYNSCDRWREHGDTSSDSIDGKVQRECPVSITQKNVESTASFERQLNYDNSTNRFFFIVINFIDFIFFYQLSPLEREVSADNRLGSRESFFIPSRSVTIDLPSHHWFLFINIYSPMETWRDHQELKMLSWRKNWVETWISINS